MSAANRTASAWRRWSCLAALIAGLLLAAGQLAAAEVQQADPLYRLAAGDRVKITVYGHEDLSGEFQVDGAGRLSLPLIRDIAAAGLTVRELEEAISAKLQPDYLKDPQVSAEVLNYRPFYIIGEVQSPGSYPYVNGMTVINAVAVAGGFTYRAKKDRVHIVRGSGDQKRRMDAAPDTAVLPGDVIEVPERFF
jgi:polysaccharide export outer membrane protein